MKKLFKFLLWLLAIVLVLIVVLYLTAGFWVKLVVSNVVPQMTKTSVTLQEADISLLSGKLAFKGFKIANPEGFQNKNAFELNEISVKFEPKSLFAQKIIINEIKIDGTKVGAEVSKTGNMNLLVLNNNVQEYLGNPTPTTKPIATEVKTKEKKSDKLVVVKDLSIINSSLDFAFLTQKLNVKLPNIHEKNIGEKKKETLPELVAGIFARLTEASAKEITKVSQESINKMLDNLAGRSKEASSLVNGLKAEMKNFF